MSDIMAWFIIAVLITLLISSHVASMVLRHNTMHELIKNRDAPSRATRSHRSRPDTQTPGHDES